MKVFLDMVGCKLNQSEIEAFANQFRRTGHTIVGSASQADLLVINTCSVTSAAASDSRQKIRQAWHNNKEVIVTGCWATLEPAVAARMPGVSLVVPNSEKDRLVSRVLGIDFDPCEVEPLARAPLPGIRQRTRAFIKVQDGCDNHCTFCVTRLARGASHSRPINLIIPEIRTAISGGAHEIVLTGVHLGSWGHEFESPMRLADLVEAILSGTPVERLRLSSLEPWDLDASFFTLWEDKRLCRHLHLPLQSGSANVLRRMARRINPAAFEQLVTTVRSSVPEIAITTDIIVGFPGETDGEYAESLEFVRSLEFAGGHVFAYSARPGTAAAHLSNQVPPPVRKQRSAQMRSILKTAENAYQQTFLGSQQKVLWESVDQLGSAGWQLHGLTDNYLRVSVCSPQPMWNTISTVHLETQTPDGLKGTIELG